MHNLETTEEHPGGEAGEGANSQASINTSRRVFLEALEHYRAELARVEAEAVGHLAAAEAGGASSSSHGAGAISAARGGRNGTGNGGTGETTAEATVVEMPARVEAERGTVAESQSGAAIGVGVEQSRR